MNKSLIAVSAFALSMLMVGCGSEGTEAPVEVKELLVKTTLVEAAEVAQTSEFTGSMEAYVENNISSSLGVRIDKINVEVGDRVRKGQVLVQMDKNQFLQTEIQLANQEADYERSVNLLQEGGISKQAVDQLETQLSVTRHVVENLRENIDLISPINGIVTARNFDPGDMFMPTGGSIITVMQMDRLKIKTNVSELYFPDVKEGMPVNITSEIYPDTVFVGKVSLKYPSINAATRTFEVEVTVNNPSLLLRPGMMCRTSMAFGAETRVLVPDIAVLKQSGSSERYLFVLDPATNTVSRKTVQVGRVVGSFYEILSGVDSGSMVVTAGMQKLLDGDKVVVVK